MTLGGVAALAPSSTGAPDVTRAPRGGSRVEQAARQFEAIFTREIVRVMRRTVAASRAEGQIGGSLGAIDGMMDDALVDAMSSGGGMGLTPQLAAQLGADVEGAASGDPIDHLPITAVRDQARASSARAPMAVGTWPTGGRGLQARVRAEVGAMLQSPERWGRDGTLDTSLLASRFAEPAGEGVARFSVGDVSGFRGEYKCNLFAYELIRRAGGAVPLVARSRGVGFPGAGQTADQAARGQLPGGWGTVVSAESQQSMGAMLREGVPLVLAGQAATEGRHGHMAVVDQVHRIERDAEGRITLLEYSGWEARSEGARYGRRSWRTVDGPSARGDVRSGFSHIQVVAPRRANAAETEGVFSGRALRASRSTDRADHPQVPPRSADRDHGTRSPSETRAVSSTRSAP